MRRITCLTTFGLLMGCSVGGRSATVFTVDPTHTQPISPFIYGANFPDWDHTPVPFTLARQGGNRLTAYNWENNASNAGADWQHENDSLMGETDEPGWAVRTFVQTAESHGAKAVIITVPCAGHVAADKAPLGDVNKTPDYIDKRFVVSVPDKPGGHYSYPPDVKDGRVYEDEFLHWIDTVRRPSTLLFCDLDNEPDIWQATHVRIVPKNVGYQGIVDLNVAYAKAVKRAAPTALVFGLVSYGWEGYVRFQDPPDANNRDFLDFYLDQMKSASATAGRRLIDALDLHWYPEARGGGSRITETGNAQTFAARIQAPRSLWDPTYTEDSWIAQNLHEPIRLLPRIFEKIKTHYPGTKLAFSEYNYGGGQDASGMVAQADVLGIFGRWGVFAAANWGVGKDDTAEIAAFDAYLNFDGAGSRFGEVSLGVEGGDPGACSCFAARDAADPSRLTAVVVNKTAAPKEFSVIFGVRIKSAKAYAANSHAPWRPRTVQANVNARTVTVTSPPYGVVTIEARS